MRGTQRPRKSGKGHFKEQSAVKRERKGAYRRPAPYKSRFTLAERYFLNGGGWKKAEKGT